ncbi:fructose bisphosphate aldolase [Hasllibacter sp. MH4015]|uniref:fructose bisphosphate aldolase n=1 Tax=Hasllibacter sp. MH4015 TaxID=2854029 RepID=UPI001CD78F48|nr:fructose bisphosphate aldolase [Hasllibacter sp. MH4015]
MAKAEQIAQMQRGAGFVAALDQSGGSTPKALRLYGVPEETYGSEDQMYDLIHQMRTRIATAPAFTGQKVIGAILFEMTMDRDIAGRPAAHYLWEERRVVPFLKIDKGLEDPAQGVRVMKAIPDLSDTLKRASDNGIFGTKARSVIDAADAQGIAANVAQQFRIGDEVLDNDMVPIIEPEVTISIADKAEAEAILLDTILSELENVPADRQVMLKLTLPESPGHYAPLVAHPRVMRVVALSGGYSRAEANARLAANSGMIASFSRALTEGLAAQQSDAEFNGALGQAIDEIHAASIT